MRGQAMSDPQYYLWLDLETTGLEIDYCDILEIAAIVTDKHYNEIHRYHSYVSPFDSGLLSINYPLSQQMEDYLAVMEKHNATSFAYNMHVETGLLNDWKEALIAETAVSLEQACLDLCQLTDKMPGEELIVLAGSSVHYDHAFLSRYFPEFARLLSHRHHDLTAIKMFMNSIKKNASDKFRDDVKPKHIAMNDLETDINWARNFRDHLVSIDAFPSKEEVPSNAP